MAWKIVKCIVEIPVLGHLSERDLAWSIKLALTETKLQAKLTGMNLNIRTGKLSVKEFGKVMTAMNSSR